MPPSVREPGKGLLEFGGYDAEGAKALGIV